ncbi:MAG: hypothetical protein RLZ75_1762 [Pseudomonadota bacterium]|jgi:flagellar basal body P-ring protein FlgI
MRKNKEKTVVVTMRLPLHVAESLDLAVQAMGSTRSKLGGRLIMDALNTSYVDVIRQAMGHRQAMEDLKRQNPDINFDVN